MKKKVQYLLAGLAAVTVLFVASAPVRATGADAKIEASFKNSYVSRVYLKDDAIKAESRSGAVTLTGTVADESHKVLAEETAASLPGVKSVDSKLATKAEAAAKNSDAWIAGKVKLALLFHRNVNAGKTDVDVKVGVVTLKGEASSQAQKELTTEYAKDVEGVKDVRNEMTVAGSPEKVVRSVGEKIDDASITAQVKLALLTHRSTSAVKTAVATHNGEVRVKGVAKNAAEKDLVTKLVEDVHGVTGVKNQMTVAAGAK
jgi:osmotically-inducible protein OsmY